jgi:hypothetical protein
MQTTTSLRLLAAVSLFTALLLSVAWVEQTSQSFTASTNASLTAVGTLSSGGQPDFGTLRRIVIGLPAGLTNLDVAVVDKDGTTLVSTNGIGAATNAAATVTWTGAFGVTPFNAPTVKMANALRVATNGSLTVTLIVTKDK